MTEALATAVSDALMISAFVGTMMIGVEYLSVLSRGTFQSALTGSRFIQYVAAALLGAVPGCLGAFTVVSLYTHRVLPLGAVVAAMIATSGDEAFVMFSLFPTTALWLTLGLAALGLAVAPIVDMLAGAPSADEPCPDLVVHEDEVCQCFPGREILAHWRHPSRARCALTVAIAAYLFAVTAGSLGPPEWNWVRVTLLFVGLLGGFVVVTVPDHFLRDHLLGHVVLKHIPRIFAWTFGVLVSVAVLGRFINVETLMREAHLGVIALAALVGIIPESGPHLLFVTLFAKGALPLSVLITSSIVQDGHGMLPLLAESRKDFIRIKAVNLAVGLGVGTVLLWLGL